MDQNLRSRLVRVLSTLDDQGSLGPRLSADAKRLWDRINHFAGLDLLGPDIDTDALELACYALQLPVRQARGLIAGKLARTNLRDRCEQAAELLVSLLGSDIDEPLLDRATRLLHETHQRSPVIDEAKLLADAMNLEDFGLIGLVGQIIQITLQGEGVDELLVAWEKREQYGYWEARLKDGFHFEPIRQLATRRLNQARTVVASLAAELTEDRAKTPKT